MPEELPDNVGAPEANPNQAQPDTDWQKRYTDTHANWNTLNEQFTKFKSDPAALVDFIRENHPDMLEEPEPDEPDYEEPDPDDEDRPLTRAEFEQWKRDSAQQAKAQTAQQQFETDLKTFVNGRELDKKGEAFIRYEARPGGSIKDPETLKKAVDEWMEFVNANTPPPKPKPHAPHVARGRAATGGKAWSEMTREEALQAQMELAAQLDTP